MSGTGAALWQSIMEPVVSTYNDLRSMDRRKLAHQVMNLAMIVCSALMIWKGLVLLSGNESPVVVVLSGSMEPTFYRGDILFIWDSGAPYALGDIVVFKVEGRPIPIIHRVVEVHSNEAGVQEVLTKGDNNEVNDRLLYNPGQMWLKRSEIVGHAIAFLPYIGHVTVQLTDYPLVKYVMVGLMGIFVLTSKE